MMRVVLLVALLAPGLSVAADGVLEINQACAVETGCFTGDLPRFPVTISQPGSYRLTSNLLVPAGVEADAVRVVSSDVTLDLNGFTIVGAATGTDAGIMITRDNVEVRNGAIRSAGRGIMMVGRLPPEEPVKGNRLVDLRILDSRVSGIDSQQAVNTQIESCAIRGSAGNGIILSGSEALIINSTATENGTGLGLFTSSATLRSNVLSSNVGSDLALFASSIVELGANQCGTNTTCP